MSGLADRWGITGFIAIIAFMLANVGAFFTALVTDIIAKDLVWVLLDVFVSPVGIIRGWLMWFGVV